MIDRINDFRYRDFYILGLALLLFGILIDNPYNNITGLYNIIKSPSILLTDYMEIGGVGSAFINAGLMTLLSSRIAQKSGARITGALIASIFIVTGFSFFGKNVINSIPLMLGVYAYVKFIKSEISNYVHILLFVTGISPVVSLFMFGLDFSLFLSFSLAILVGLIIGFIIIPLSNAMLVFHEGYSLYNVGFSLGIIGLFIAGILRMFDIEIPTLRFEYIGNDTYSFAFLLAFSVGMIILGFIQNGGLKGYDHIISQSGKLITDFTLTTNKGLVLVNMGLMGLISIIFVKISGGVINGPLAGGIFTVIGFAAFGKHPKNVLPVMAGVFIASTLNKYEPSSTDAILVALFATTLAPIAGEFGVLAGILAGFLHKAAATNVGIIHGGMNLYNNGLAGGLVAGLMVPLLKNFNERFRRD